MHRVTWSVIFMISRKRVGVFRAVEYSSGSWQWCQSVSGPNGTFRGVLQCRDSVEAWNPREFGLWGTASRRRSRRSEYPGSEDDGSGLVHESQLLGREELHCREAVRAWNLNLWGA